MPVCPHCGSNVRQNAKFCRECGSDARTGWARDAETDSLELPDREFTDDGDYQDFLAREGLGGKRKGSALKRWFVVTVILLVLLGFVLLTVFRPY
ncbi:MAG: zinc-ribbon domain-containing protein [Planctomycetota bacterium]